MIVHLDLSILCCYAFHLKKYHKSFSVNSLNCIFTLKLIEIKGVQKNRTELAGFLRFSVVLWLKNMKTEGVCSIVGVPELVKIEPN